MFLKPGSSLSEKFSDAVDFLIVNFLYVLFCLPVFTIGAAQCALYETSFSYLNYQESGARIFLRAFKNNFRSITPIYLLLLALAVFLLFDLYIVVTHEIILYKLMCIVLAFIFVVFAFVTTQLFLVHSRFVCTKKQLFVNAILISLAHPLRTIIIGLLNLFPWMLLALDPHIFFSVLPVFILAYHALASYFSAKCMQKPFLKYEDQVKGHDE